MPITSTVQELEALGAKGTTSGLLVVWISPSLWKLTSTNDYQHTLSRCSDLADWFCLSGWPSRQDHPKAIDALKRLNRPYMVALPLVFQTTEEWMDSDLGLHPIQVALQIAIPELDGAIEPIILSGRDDTTGKAIALRDRVEAVARPALKGARLRCKPNDKKVAITVFTSHQIKATSAPSLTQTYSVPSMEVMKP